MLPGGSMKILRLSCVLVIVVMAASPSFAGDIQILCEPGVRVYLDRQFKGVTNAREDGLFLMGVERGKHTISVEKDGHVSQFFEVELLGAPIELEVPEFTALPVVSPAAAAAAVPEPEPEPVTQLLGSLKVTSAPQNCLVEIAGDTREKTSPELVIGGLPVGEHTITFSKPGFEPIRGVVTVREGAEVTVRGNLLDGKVETTLEGKGSLRVLSKPLRCDVSILGMQRMKTQRHLNMAFLPAGNHRLTVGIPGKTMSADVLILDRTRTVVEVSFTEGEEPFVIRHVPLD
jgi:hypothetical protein